jgi:hypothetical protein
MTTLGDLQNKQNIVTYRILIGPDKNYIAFRLEGRQEVALAKEKTLDALASRLFIPGQRIEFVTGEKRGYLKVGQEDLLLLKQKMKK